MEAEGRRALLIPGDVTQPAQSLVERGIRVSCVTPGPVWTPLNPSDKPADKVATFGQKAPMKRPAQPEEIAPAFVFFASEAERQLRHRRDSHAARRRDAGGLMTEFCGAETGVVSFIFVYGSYHFTVP